jgi:tetratricopeptide (TPR) repeat protein
MAALGSNPFEQSLGLVREIGDTWMMMQALNVLGKIRLQQGEQALARELFEACLETSKEHGESLDIAEMQIDLARVLAVQGETARVCALYQESLILLQKNGENQEFIPACLEGLAAMASAQGEPTWAARLWGTSEAQREAYGTPLAAIYRAH